MAICLLCDVFISQTLIRSTSGPAASHLLPGIALDAALQGLAQIDQRKSQVVELRFFGGLTVEETAGVLNVSPETVRRDWRLAKSWLRRRLSEDVDEI